MFKGVNLDDWYKKYLSNPFVVLSFISIIGVIWNYERIIKDKDKDLEVCQTKFMEMFDEMLENRRYTNNVKDTIK